MKAVHIAIAVVLAVALAAVHSTFFRPVEKERAALAAQLEGLQKTNALLQARIAELRRRQADFRTDEEYVELEARRNGLTRADETVFDFSVERR